MTWHGSCFNPCSTRRGTPQATTGIGTGAGSAHDEDARGPIVGGQSAPIFFVKLFGSCARFLGAAFPVPIFRYEPACEWAG